MKRVKHLIFWFVLLGLVLLLFSSHVLAEDDFYRQRHGCDCGAVILTVGVFLDNLHSPGDAAH